MARERLTSRARQAADDKTPYPGSLNQENREEEDRGSMTYRTFEPSVANHEKTDYTRVHGVSDQHNEIGMGIPDPASGMLVASPEYQAKCIKAAELAETFLGPKVNDRILLAQARDFLSLDDEVLDRTLERFCRTDAIYASDEEAVEAEESCKAEDEEAVEAEESCKAEDEEAVEAEESCKAEDEEAVEAEDEEAVEAEENDTNKIPEMPEGEAASPQVNDADSVGVLDSDAAVNTPEDVAEVNPEEKTNMLARLAAATLKEDERTKENIVARAKKLSSLDEEQISMLLDSKEEAKKAEEKEEAIEAEEKEEGEIEVASAQSIDIGSFDLSEEFNDAPVSASKEEEAELASIFEDGGMMPQFPTAADNSFLESISELAKGKVASKLGVKSVGSAKLQEKTPVPESNELESIWNSPTEFPGGGF